MLKTVRTAHLPTDAHRVPVPSLSTVFSTEKSVTFAGGTANAIGDHDGTGDPFTIFTVTGTVLARVFGVCETSLTGDTATLEVGVTGGTATLIAQSTATDIDAGEIWHDNAPDAKVEAFTVASEKIIANGADIIGTVATANITAGVIRFFCLWYPLSSDGNVIAA